MTCTNNTEIEKSQLWKGLRSLGRAGIAMMLLGLTSCVSNLPPSVSDLNIYQPSTLRLTKGEAIQTRDGIYTPQTDEVWHSDARYRRLEREFYHGSGNK